MAMAGYVTECQIDEPELFSQLASDLREDEWNSVLRFCPFQPVDSALRNLDLIVSALEEACIGLNAAKAGMETAMDSSRSRLATHQREQSKATAQLLNFGALYASYVDVCRRIRRRCNLGDQKSYERAIARLVAKNKGAHSFAKDLRNYTLHFQVPEPYVTIELSENRKVSLLLDSSALLYSGFKWKATSRDFLQNNAKLDILETATEVTKDVVRLVRFHRKIVDARLADMKFAYETYLNERVRHKHLRDAVVDVGAAFRMPRSLISRLLEDNFVEQVLESALPDKDAEMVIVEYANRHRNLPKKVLQELRIEVGKKLESRPRFPTGGAFLSKRKVE